MDFYVGILIGVVLCYTFLMLNGVVHIYKFNYVCHEPGCTFSVKTDDAWAHQKIVDSHKANHLEDSL